MSWANGSHLFALQKPVPGQGQALNKRPAFLSESIAFSIVGRFEFPTAPGDLISCWRKTRRGLGGHPIARIPMMLSCRPEDGPYVDSRNILARKSSRKISGQLQPSLTAPWRGPVFKLFPRRVEAYFDWRQIARRIQSHIRRPCHALKSCGEGSSANRSEQVRDF